VDEDINSDLSKVELEKGFEHNYQQWLDQEVFEEDDRPVGRSSSPTFMDED